MIKRYATLSELEVEFMEETICRPM